MSARPGVIAWTLILAVAACQPQADEPAADAAESAAAADTPTATTARPASTADIRGLVDRMLVAWNQGDTAALEPIIAEDVVLLQPDGPVLEGRPDILGMIAGAYDVSTFQQSATVDEVIPLGDHAWARGSWHLEPSDEAGPEVEPADGKWSGLYELGPNGEWRLWRWMWNQPSPEAPEGEPS
jgi:ketosteroid isomerase-like protein